ncbi:MAG: hypothetical protein HEQ32_01295 [Vampirovibrio sp.]
MNGLKTSWLAILSTTLTCGVLLIGGFSFPILWPAQAVAAETLMEMGNSIVIEANEQEVDLKRNISYFRGNVIVTSGNTVIKSPHGRVIMDEKAQPALARFEGGVVLTKGSDSLKAETLIFDFKENAFTASGQVDTRITPTGKAPVRIQSDTQQYLKARSQMLAKGHVHVDSEDAKATAEQALLVLAADNSAERVTFIGNAMMHQKDADVYAERIILSPKQNIFMAEGQAFTKVLQAGHPKPIILRAAFQQLDRNKGFLIASGSVDLDFEVYKARGPKAVFYMKPGQGMTLERAVFSGRSTLNEGKTREVTADVIEVTVNPRHFDARGNVKTKLIQEPRSKSVSRRPAKASSIATGSKGRKAVTEEDEYDPKAFDLGGFNVEDPSS